MDQLARLKKKTVLYSSDYLELIQNPYSQSFQDPRQDSRSLQIDSLPVEIFKIDISNRMQYSAILDNIKEPINEFLGSVVKNVELDDRVFLLGSRAFSEHYKPTNSMQRVAVIPGNYDILHVTNRTINKARIIESIISKLIELQTKLHTQYSIPTVIRLINHGKKIRDELCLFPNCTGVMMDFLGWNTHESIEAVTVEDQIKGIIPEEDTLESVIFFNSVMVDNPKRFDQITVESQYSMPILNELGLQLFFNLIGERVYKNFPVDKFRQQLLPKSTLKSSIQLFTLFDSLFGTNVPEYNKANLLVNMIKSLSPGTIETYTESLVEYFRGYVNYCIYRIHNRFSTELKDNAFIISTGGDTFKRYVSGIGSTQDYDFKVFVRASKSGKKEREFTKISKRDIITVCYEIITDELINFMYSVNNLLEKQMIVIPVIEKVFNSIDEYMKIEIHSTVFNPNVVNFRLRKGDKTKTRIYSVDFRCHIYLHYSINGVTINEKLNYNIPLIDIGVVDAYDHNPSVTLDELRNKYQYKNKPVGSAEFLMSDMYKTWTSPSNYKLRFGKKDKDKFRIEQLIGDSGNLLHYSPTSELPNIPVNYNEYYDKQEFYTIPDASIKKHYKKIRSDTDGVVFENTFKKTFEAKEWSGKHKEVLWENNLWKNSKQEFDNWVNWQKTRERKPKQKESEFKVHLEPESPTGPPSDLDLYLDTLVISDSSPQVTPLSTPEMESFIKAQQPSEIESELSIGEQEWEKKKVPKTSQLPIRHKKLDMRISPLKRPI